MVTGSMMLVALFFARYFISPYPVEKPFVEGMPLAEWLTRWSIVHTVWSGVVIFLLVVWTTFIVTRLAVRYTSATSRNYISIPVFVVAVCGVFVPAEALASYLAAWLFALATRQFMLTFRKDYRFTEAFRGGFYLGFIPLLYAPGALLLALVPMLATLYRRSGRELVVSGVGALLPTFGTWFVGWASGDDGLGVFRKWWHCVSHRGASIWPTEFPIMAAICGGVIVALTAMALVWFMSKRKGMRTRGRKVMTHLSLAFLLLAVSFVAPGASSSGIPLLGVTSAMAIPYLFTARQSIVPSVLYILVVAAVVVMNVLSLRGISVP
jgi:hypothetical protein